MLRAALFVVIPAVPAANTIDRVGGDGLDRRLAEAENSPTPILFVP
jgi:hypothetical protein